MENYPMSEIYPPKIIPEPIQLRHPWGIYYIQFSPFLFFVEMEILFVTSPNLIRAPDSLICILDFFCGYHSQYTEIKLGKHDATKLERF